MKNKELMSKIVERLNAEPGIIILHHNADVDAVGSALALQCAYPNYHIGAFQKISQVGKTIIKYFKNITIFDSPDLSQYNNVVILDASTPSQLGISQELSVEPIVIDHHACNDVWDTEYYYCDDSKSSCAELVLELLDFIKFDLTQRSILAILVGILADTGQFKYANHDSFVNFARLLDLGKLTMADVLTIFGESEQKGISQRIAHLKGAQRLRFQRLNGYLVAVSQLSSFEAAMCKKLIDLGADVAFVGSQHGDEVRISARASNELVNKGLHLGEFFQSLGSDLLIEGGGHAGAAGLNGIFINKISKNLNI